MRIRAMITHLEAIARKHGDNIECLYSKDDEGNAFNLVHYSPSVGYFDGDEFDTEDIEKDKINAVCIN